MTWPGPWAAWLLLVTGLLAAPRAGATDSTLALRYDVHYGPLRLLSIETTSTVGDAHYRVRSQMETTGAIGYLFPWRARSESEGVREQATLRPQRHRSDGRFRGESRVVELDYDADGDVRARIEPPPDDDARDAVPAALQHATLDPLTASLASLLADCTGTLPVFDGRRRYDLRLEELAPAQLERSSRRLYAGPARRCRATVEARAGFWRTDPRDSETPTTLDFWIATPAPGIAPVPVYLELSGARGTLSIDLTDVRPGGLG